MVKNLEKTAINTTKNKCLEEQNITFSNRTLRNYQNGIIVTMHKHVEERRNKSISILCTITKSINSMETK
jgi:hypothetical protein